MFGYFPGSGGGWVKSNDSANSAMLAAVGAKLGLLVQAFTWPLLTLTFVSLLLSAQDAFLLALLF